MKNMKLPPIVTKIIDTFSKSETKNLDLSNLGLDDEELNEIDDDDDDVFEKCMNKIESINLSRNSITHKSCKILKLLPNLKEINVSSTSIDDTGVEELLKLKNIIKLDISDCDISDAAGKKLLENISQFDSLNYSGNLRFSKETLEKFDLYFKKQFGTDKTVKLDQTSKTYNIDIKPTKSPEEMGASIFQQRKSELNQFSDEEKIKILLKLGECLNIKIKTEEKTLTILNSPN